MQIATETFPLRLRQTFTIARESHDVVETVIATLEADGISGFGEGSPSSFYGHTAASVRTALAKVAPALGRADPRRFRHLLEGLLEDLGGDRAALCAIDLALWDWTGKALGVPITRLLGVDPARSPPSSFTIGIDSIEVMRSKTRAAKAFPILKIKLGTDRDLEILRALRQETRAVFRVDANCAWGVEETVEKSRELRALGVEYIEQPLPADQLDAMEKVYRESALPVFADESSILPEDVPRLAGRFHGINIKLVKCGGLLPALRMVHLARTLGLKIMVGCMIESSVGISAGAQIGPLVDHLDLDGALLTANDPFDGVALVDGRLVYPERPGHGAIRRSTV
jgi:L-alanine-DL-glutamate epimerase-like enolase superfamily enzyme